MEQVKINVYDFKELDKKIQERLIEVLNAVDNLVGIDNFIDLIDRLDKLTRECD